MTKVCENIPPRGDIYPGVDLAFTRDLAFPKGAPHKSQLPSPKRLHSPINRCNRGKQLHSA